MTARLRSHAVRGALAALLLLPSTAAAQASPYVPLDDVAYAFVDALQARGRLRALPTLERPYTAAAIDRAAAAEGAVSGIAGRWLAQLRERAAWHLPARTGPVAGRDSAAVDVVASLGARATAQTTTRGELLLADDEPGAFAGGQLRIAATAGPVVLGARYVLDQRWRDDPDFTGYTEGGVAGRVEEGYVAGQWRFGELLFGRLARSWGPARLPGLLVGTDAPLDHLYGRLGPDALHLSTIVARLDDVTVPDVVVAQRYLSVHRLAARWRSLEVALSESYVYGGDARGLEPSLVNPLAPVLLTHYNEDEDGNVTFAAEAAWRPGWGVFGVQALVDDFQFESGAETTEEPASYGVTATAEGLPLWGEQRLFVSYTRVANLTYRTPNAFEAYTHRGLGLGRAFADHDEWRAGADLALLPWAPVRLYGAVRRQGEGDYRLPFPPIADYAETPAFLAGRVARVTRVGVETAGRAGGLAWRLDAGYNTVREAGRQVPGARGSTVLAPSGAAGRLTLTWEPGLLAHRFSVR